jgi:hypothetical protein
MSRQNESIARSIAGWLRFLPYPEFAGRRGMADRHAHSRFSVHSLGRATLNHFMGRLAPGFFEDSALGVLDPRVLVSGIRLHLPPRLSRHCFMIAATDPSAFLTLRPTSSKAPSNYNLRSKAGWRVASAISALWQS